MRPLIYGLIVLATILWLISATVYAHPQVKKYSYDEDFVYCHVKGVYKYDDVPKSSIELLRAVIEGNKRNVKLAKVQLLLNGHAGLHLAPWTAYKVLPIPQKNWACYLMVMDQK